MTEEKNNMQKGSIGGNKTGNFFIRWIKILGFMIVVFMFMYNFIINLFLGYSSVYSTLNDFYIIFFVSFVVSIVGGYLLNMFFDTIIYFIKTVIDVIVSFIFK